MNIYKRKKGFLNQLFVRIKYGQVVSIKDKLG